MLEHEDLSKVRLLVLANKQDVKGCMTAAEISQQLQLTEMKNHSWNIQVFKINLIFKIIKNS